MRFWLDKTRLLLAEKPSWRHLRNTTHRYHSTTRKQHSASQLLESSYVEGPLHPPLHQSTIYEYFLSAIIAKHGDKTALVSCHEPAEQHGGPLQQDPSSNIHWNFEEMDIRAAALSRGLSQIGITKGDRVAVVMGNCSAYALLQWACARIGAILVTINPAYKMNEIINTLNLVGVKCLVTVPRLRSSQYLASLVDNIPSLSSALPGEIQDPALPSLRSLIVVDNSASQESPPPETPPVRAATDIRELFAWQSNNNRLDPLDQHDLINLQFTSGTTGAPKAVSLTHHNLLNNGWFIGRCMNLTPDDKLCNLAAWTHGASIVYASETYDPRAILRALHEEKCTAVHGVPTHFLGLLSELDKEIAKGSTLDLSRLRTGIAAGSPIPIELMKRLIDRLNLIDLSIAYGMTETSPVSFQTTPEDPLIKRVETVGKVQPHVKAKVVDENHEVVPVGTPGELCVSGYLVQRGYWQDPEQTAQVYYADEGDPHTLWMHTGDTAIMDEEGYLRIVGRIKDIIIRGGENLFPVQIENVLTRHPAIHEAAAVSVPDSVYGEVVGAWIVRKPGSVKLSRKEIREWVAANMNPQNAPAWIFFVGEDGVQAELPKTASGKIMKNILRDWSRAWSKEGIGKVE
ncbi:hypothetical protein FRC03_004322 [Tulasnella sp. 419]|nr:hypothetical protein FRC03_004322 [Tulasnella sp. 419]